MEWVIFFMPVLAGIFAIRYFARRGSELTDDKWDNQ
jgi:hypothetical protein